MEIKKRDIAKFRMTIRETSDGSSLTASLDTKLSKKEVMSKFLKWLEVHEHD